MFLDIAENGLGSGSSSSTDDNSETSVIGSGDAAENNGTDCTPLESLEVSKQLMYLIIYIIYLQINCKKIIVKAFMSNFNYKSSRSMKLGVSDRQKGNVIKVKY